jgi:hypothetical protein
MRTRSQEDDSPRDAILLCEPARQESTSGVRKPVCAGGELNFYVSAEIKLTVSCNAWLLDDDKTDHAPWRRIPGLE